MRNIFCLMAIALCMTTSAVADIIELNNGKVVKGAIVLRTDDLIKVEVGVGIPITYYSDEIKKITEEEESIEIEESGSAPQYYTDDDTEHAMPLEESEPIVVNEAAPRVAPAPAAAPKVGAKSKPAALPKSPVSDMEIPLKKKTNSADQSGANKVGNQGITLVQEGKIEEGLALMKQATELAPKDPSWHMNYGSMLFSKGGSLYKEGLTNEAMPIIQEAENELLLASTQFDSLKGQKLQKSQCFFLLGDIYFHLHGDKTKAKEYYNKSLVEYPKHQEALDAIKNIDQL